MISENIQNTQHPSSLNSQSYQSKVNPEDKIQIEKNLENSNSNINNLNIQNLESNSGSFLINVQTLEELMGAYKERGLKS